MCWGEQPPSPSASPVGTSPVGCATAPCSSGVEIRDITLAQGIEFNNTDLSPWPFLVIPNGLTAPLSSRNSSWPASMQGRAPLPITVAGNTFSFMSAPQNVEFRVTIVTNKEQFRQALLAPNRHVIYAGHARYGRGPCFGPNPVPGEDWENGSDPTARGLFRMGHRFIGVPVEEILDHGYTADLVPSNVPIPRSEAEHYLVPHLGSLRARRLVDIHRDLPTRARDRDPTRTWWSYRSLDHGRVKPYVVLHAGWERTVSAPADLGATTPACRVFCHFGCDTRRHNHRILRDRRFKGWVRTGDDRFAYFTTDIADIRIPVYWLYHLFTYSTPNAFGNWEPSLSHAVRMTNDDLTRDGMTFQII